MKKLCLIITIMILFTAILSANIYAINIGDKLGDVLNIDVKTYIDGVRIPCYNINNKSVVLISDLRNYGFDVVYNDESKTSTVTRNYDKQFTPPTDIIVNNTEKPGTVAFSYLYTDIIAIVNGKKVDSVNIKGNIAIYFEDLKDYGTFKWDNNSRASLLTLYKNPTSQYVFSLTDDEIKEAIEEGKKGIVHLLNNINPKYIVKAKIESETLSKYNEIKVLTPYLFIMTTSALQTNAYKSYSFESAKVDYVVMKTKNMISFTFDLCELLYDNNSGIAIGFFQNDKIIEPTTLSGLTGFPDRSNTYPKQPAYYRLVNASIDQSDIDINIPITIKINYAGLEEAIYEVNLKNYK